MNLTPEEKETIINFNEGEDYVSVYTFKKSWQKQMIKLAEEYPDECRVVFRPRTDGSMEFYCPKSWVKCPKPPRKCNLTDEQKAALAERLKSSRTAEKTT